MATQTTALYDIMLKHEKQDYRQYNAEHRYRGWMGNTPNSIIQRKNQLESDGESVRLHFTDDIGYRNIGVGALEGNEATFGTDYYDLKPYWFREAIKLKKSEAKKAYTNQAAIQRHSVRTWNQNMEYEAIIDAFDAIGVDAAAFVDTGNAAGTVVAHGQQITYAEGTAAQRNAFLTANAERLLFGSTLANTVAGDMAASLANVDAAADKASLAILRKLKQLARADNWRAGGARPIRPLRSDKSKGRDFFKVTVGQQTFGALKEDEELKRYNTDARLRGVEDHPIFQDGDLLYDGMIICEEVREKTYAGAGAAGADVEVIRLFGGQALARANGQNMKYTKSDNRDYEFFDGVGVESQYSYEKLFYTGGARDGKMHGMAQAYVAV